MSTENTDTTTEASSTTESSCGATSASEASTDASTGSKCGASTTEESTSSDCGASSDSSSSSGCGAKTKSETTDEKVAATAEDFEGDPGRLIAVGLGPGHAEGMTQRARAALLEAEHIVGYTTYIDLLPDEIVEEADDIYDTPMCGEVSRTEESVDRALAGNDVAIVGSGDPNVYALGGLALEIVESKGTTPSAVDFEVVPGVPAAQSCAARLGAPLVNDTVTVYNPWSRKRRENWETCCDVLMEHRSDDVPVGVVHGAGREDEQVEIVELSELKALGETDLVDMTTTVLVGNEETYVEDGRMVTPRGYETKYDY